MRRFVRVGLAVVLMVGMAIAARSQPAHAAANPWPHIPVSGFSTGDGNGFWLAYADGSVAPLGDAHWQGDAMGLALSGPVVGGAAPAGADGYWLVASDGGIFSYGTALFYGSMGAAHLNQPVFSMAPTKSGKGYWLVARDGGIFTFGDGRFYGSAGALPLNQPIAGITTSPTGKGYRLVARDGGIFSFGDAPFSGSLPGLGIAVTDVVGAASTPTNKGYWIAEADGRVHAFGDAHNFGNYTPTGCGAVTGIFSNPAAQGYRLVVQSGTTVSFGAAPGGIVGTAPPDTCPKPSLPPPTSSSYSYVSAPGDFIGAGESATIKPAPEFRFDVTGRSDFDGLRLSAFQIINGGAVRDWSVDLAPPYGQTLHLGTYTTKREHGPNNAGLDAGQDGRGCNNSYGTLTINYLAYENASPGRLALLDATFVQHCESPTAPPFRGHIRFNNADRQG